MSNFNLNQCWAGPGSQQPLAPMGAQNMPLREDTLPHKIPNQFVEDISINLKKDKWPSLLLDFQKTSPEDDLWR